MFSKRPIQVPVGYQSHQLSSTSHNVKPATVNKVQTVKRFINNRHNCNKNHAVNNCSAYGQVCYKCGKRNHFANLCKSSKKVYQVCSQHVNNFEQSDMPCVNSSYTGNAGPQLDFSIDVLGLSENKPKVNVWIEKLTIHDQPVRFKLDTGAQTNVLPLSLFDKLSLHKTLIRSTIVN